VKQKPLNELLILGIDPGLNVTGYGILSVQNNSPRIVEGGVICSTASDPLGTKLLALYNGLTEVLNSFAPEAVAMEELYSHYEHPTTAILMGHARGVLCLAVRQFELQVHSYAATQVKKMLTGNGRAPKEQVQSAIARWLHLPEIPQPPDVADALAVALCHHYISQQPASLT
jgi:crossover junction endodeoxyribonuclease RuvC